MILEKTDGFCVERFSVGPLQTNCYLIYDTVCGEGVVIDPGWRDAAITRGIRDAGVKVKYVINTHGHADHVTGNNLLDAPVLIHRLDGKMSADPSKNLPFFSAPPAELSARTGTLDDGDVLDVGNLKLEVIHTPGHTPGGISIKCRDMVFSGDTLFFEGIGRTDLPGGDLETILRSIKEKLLSLPDDVRVFPGHGPETTILDAKRFIREEFF